MKKDDNNNKSSNQSSNSYIRKQFMKGDKQSFSNWSKDWKDERNISNLFFGPKHGRLRAGRGLFCIAFSFIFAVLITFDMNPQPNIRLGDVATETVRSPYDLQVIDKEATERRQKNEVEKVPLVLDYYPNIYENKIERLRDSFSMFRDLSINSKLSETAFYENYYKEFEKAWGNSLDKRIFKWLYSEKFNLTIERAILNQLELWSTNYMAEESQMREGLKEGYAMVRIIKSDGEISGEDQKLDLNRIEKIVSYEALDEGISVLGDFNKYDRRKIVSILRGLKEPNLILNRAVYSKRKAEVQKNTIPIIIPVKKNQFVVKKGSLIQEQDVLLINEINERTQSLKKKSKAFFISFILVIILLSGLSLLKREFKFSILQAKQDFIVLFAISFFGLVVTKLFIFLFEGAIYQRFGENLFSDIVILMSPFAMLFMLATLLVKSKPLNWLFVTYFAVGLSFLSADKFSFLVVALIAGFISVGAISLCRSRRDFYFSGFAVGVVIGLTAILIYSLEMQTLNLEVLPSLIFIFGASVLGGILSAIFTVTFVPLFESIFDIMTDLKLLELSNLSHPLLKDLMVRAPGTYHHCMVVGSMVEAACDEIGVNGLLGKVMSYFHDVGKMEHSSYFIENQTKGYNPHDTISPYLSKTIIIAHVKDGVELISKYKLGRDILAGVKEHHGTTLINYFYKKAQTQSDENEKVKEEDFRYPGPKPQFKESAILMLADSIEAAARTIDEPSPLKIQTLIDNMVDLKFKDGQLEECHITFSEVRTIKESFYKILVGVYHHRVEYPEEDLTLKKQNHNKRKTQRAMTLLPPLSKEKS